MAQKTLSAGRNIALCVLSGPQGSSTPTTPMSVVSGTVMVQPSNTRPRLETSRLTMPLCMVVGFAEAFEEMRKEQKSLRKLTTKGSKRSKKRPRRYRYESSDDSSSGEE